MSTSRENLVNFGPATPEFMRVVGVHAVVGQQFSVGSGPGAETLNKKSKTRGGMAGFTMNPGAVH